MQEQIKGLHALEVPMKSVSQKQVDSSNELDQILTCSMQQRKAITSGNQCVVGMTIDLIAPNLADATLYL